MVSSPTLPFGNKSRKFTLLHNGPLIIYPLLDLVKVSAFVMSIKVRLTARWAPLAYQQRRNIAPALE